MRVSCGLSSATESSVCYGVFLRDMGKVTVVTTTWNSEKTIDRTLSSVRWADEVIIVDATSIDRTCDIAKKHHATVFVRENNPMLNQNKNYGFTKANGDWILSLDSDEEIPPELAQEIRSCIARRDATVGYWIPRKNMIFGKWIRYGLWWPDKQLRLFKKGYGKYPCRHVHEYLEVDGPTRDLTTPYIHHNYDSISQFLHKMDVLYTESEVQKLLDTDYQLTWQDAIRFPVSDFVKIYFAQEGYRDGLHGLVLAMLQSFYSFVVFAKLWEQRGFDEEDIALSDVSSEIEKQGSVIRYWQVTNRIKETRSRLEKLWLRMLRRYVSRA
jgi:(heptosyl)LPS beta-1,4-glucosyltransferase